MPYYKKFPVTCCVLFILLLTIFVTSNCIIYSEINLPFPIPYYMTNRQNEFIVRAIMLFIIIMFYAFSPFFLVFQKISFLVLNNKNMNLNSHTRRLKIYHFAISFTESSTTFAICLM